MRMPNYRRAFVPGGCWFFTVNLLERRQTLLIDRVDTLRSAFEETRKSNPFDIAAVVVLPDHLHAVWTLPPDDADFSTRWRLIKTRFAKTLPKQERRSAVRRARNERGIWQRRFWEHLIRTTPIMRATWNIVISTRSNTASSGACKTGRIRRFTATCGAAYFRSIGQEKLNRQVSSASEIGNPVGPV